MKSKIKLLPGTPDDANRDYLPEKIKGSDIVVNENGNNSRPYPARLQEKREVVFGDEEDVWYEYVPETYDPSKKTPACRVLPRWTHDRLGSVHLHLVVVYRGQRGLHRRLPERTYKPLLGDRTRPQQTVPQGYENRWGPDPRGSGQGRGHIRRPV